jgi:hypothetical protein
MANIEQIVDPKTIENIQLINRELQKAVYIIEKLKKEIELYELELKKWQTAKN